MTPVQKVIKYCAVAFAIFLIVGIVGGIAGAFAGIGWISGESSDAVGEVRSYAINEDVTDLKVELSGARLEIRTGDAFAVESDHKYLKLENSGGLLSIKESRKVYGFNSGGVRVILTVPRGFEFGKAAISAGAGKVDIDTLTAETLSFELGAGEVNIGELTASRWAKIEGGAGQLSIDGGELRNLDFDMGVGEVNMRCRLTGDSSIDCGVGELDLVLMGDADDYRIELDKGIGSSTVEGKSMHDGEVYGSGASVVEIDGGIGEINIRFGR